MLYTPSDAKFFDTADAAPVAEQIKLGAQGIGKCDACEHEQA